MKDQEWHFRDKSDWPIGPWKSEPDKVQFTDVETGYPCLIVRNNVGSLCGYVGVTSGHPAFQQNYNNVDADVHGGLTFSDFCQPGDKEHGICHIVELEEDDRVWWLGFDCSHCFDVCPSMPILTSPFHEVEYRTIEYVKNQIAGLARQLKEQGGK